MNLTSSKPKVTNPTDVASPSTIQNMRLLCSLFLGLFVASGDATLAAQDLGAECDPTTLRNVLEAVLKIESKDLDRDYLLTLEAIPVESSREPSKEGSYRECQSFDAWPREWIQVGHVRPVPRDSIDHMSFSLFISRPAFNPEGTECIVRFANHESEWGGGKRYLYFKKRGRKWKLVRASLISVY